MIGIRILQVLLLAVVSGGAVSAQKKIFYPGAPSVDVIIDGNRVENCWTVMPSINPDVFQTTAKEIIFISDRDTLKIDQLKEWETFDFAMVTNEGDTANVRVERMAANPFENPSPQLLKVSPSGILTKSQAQFDIDAMIYTLSQVHPDIFSTCSKAELFQAVNRAKAALPDSVSPVDLYRVAAPIVAMIGDGHTNLNFPYNSIFTPQSKRLPVFVDVLPDKTLSCRSSLDSIIGRGDKVLSINGISSDSIVNAMLPFVSGEKTHIKLSRVNSLFSALHKMLFDADEYVVRYQPNGSKKILSHIFPGSTYDEIMQRCPKVRSGNKHDIYSFEVDSVNNVAVMDFRSFSNTNRMVHFADSMFRELKNKNITNLIIDLRNNGGGNSEVGDILLQYISPEPFVQMEKSLIRVTPTTAKLIGNGSITPMFELFETNPSDYILPRTVDQGHYSGKVYLLTSNSTFSSAGSFAWAFKVCGMGTVIGEETGGMNVHYGDILSYDLPISQLNMSISFKRFWQFRADEKDIHGTIPDISVPSSRALDEAMKLAKKNKRK
ncbi:MAG: hypothetical protein HDR89_04525 [Bacteroides sp.]|nr:hypothetical protein [Bacteroides sp.]